MSFFICAKVIEKTKALQLVISAKGSSNNFSVFILKDVHLIPLHDCVSFCVGFSHNIAIKYIQGWGRSTAKCRKVNNTDETHSTILKNC